MAPEPQGHLPPLPPGPPASPLLLSCPHQPGLGIQPHALRRGGPSENRACRRWWAWWTQGLFHHSKHFLISRAPNASPDVSSDPLLLSSRQKNSLLNLFLPLWLGNLSIIPARSLRWGPRACSERRSDPSEGPDVGHGLNAHRSPYKGARGDRPHRGLCFPTLPAGSPPETPPHGQSLGTRSEPGEGPRLKEELWNG